MTKRILLFIILLAILPAQIFSQGTSAKVEGQHYPAVPDMFGGPMGIERVAYGGFPLDAHHKFYKSEVQDSAGHVIRLQIDLGNPYNIDEVKLYPVIVHTHPSVRSNFPLRFRIETDNDPEFPQPQLVFDHTGSDLVEEIAPERIEKFRPAQPVRGRYVRLTVTKLNTTDNKKFLFELWRFEVISGGKDVAEGRPLYDSERGFLGKHDLLRPQRPSGEGVVTDNPENVTQPETWKPVHTNLSVPRDGVSLAPGLFKTTMERNAEYLMNTYTADEMLNEYRLRAGKPSPAKMKANFWIDQLHGSNAGRFLLGAGNYLRWTEDKRLRTRLNEIVDGVEDCRDPNGYYIMGFPEKEFFYHENSGYCRSMLTQGLIEASIAGNQKALPMLRAYYDWFNRCPYLPEIVQRGHFGRQGIIASTRLYNTPVGKPEDLQVVQRYYIEDYWMKQLVDRDIDAIWKLPYDRPHCYLIPTLESYADLYKATGEQQYLDAVFGGWDLYKDYYQHIGGAISVCEGAPFPPKSNLLDGRTGELCGNVFWIFLNQRLHLLYPEEEKYVNEIEKSIYNVALPDQSQNGSIRYHTKLVHRKSNGDMKNTCCELQGTRLFSALPEFIYTKAADGIFVDLFHSSKVTWEHDGKLFKMEMTTHFPNQTDVKLKLSLRRKAASNIRIRVPAWATQPVDILINGKVSATGAPGSYVSLQREWSNNDIISFELPIEFKITAYEGATQPYCDKDKHTHALEYGPILMALTGESISKGQITLPFPASQLVGKLLPEDEHGHEHSHALHFKIAGVDDETLRFVPYYEIEKEKMTCFAFFTGK
ncbi:MAG: glycoside hydrolase family 127 protein [Tannerella sp.]|nr:glycoside hydrolase family 127 protein [Tannerella sp.]